MAPPGSSAVNPSGFGEPDTRRLAIFPSRNEDLSLRQSGAGVDLSAFLEDLSRQPFVDGAADCVLSVADWIVLSGHPDPAQPYRGRYRTALGRQRLIRQSGGLHVLMSEGAARAGLTETTTPVRGDVGLIVAHGQTVAAICLGERWAIKGDGLVVAPAERILMAWRV